MSAVIGIDPAFGGRDATGVVIIKYGRVTVAEETRVDFFALVNVVCDLAKAHRAHLVIDATGTGRPFFEAVQERHSGPVTGVVFGRSNTKSKQEGALWKVPSASVWDCASGLVRSGRVRFAQSCQGEQLLSDQLRRVMRRDTPTGQERVSGKQGRKTDDVATAFALACWGIEHAPSVPSLMGRVPAIGERVWAGVL